MKSYIHSELGLFPLPIGRNAKAAVVNKAKSKFKFLGKFMAKSVMDSRMVRRILQTNIPKLLYRFSEKYFYV